MYERRRLERRLRDKEAAYQEVCVHPLSYTSRFTRVTNAFFSLFLFVFFKRLKNWEIRERKKSRDYSKDAERDADRRREVVNINPCS